MYKWNIITVNFTYEYVCMMRAWIYIIYAHIVCRKAWIGSWFHKMSEGNGPISYDLSTEPVEKYNYYLKQWSKWCSQGRRRRRRRGRRRRRKNKRERHFGMVPKVSVLGQHRRVHVLCGLGEKVAVSIVHKGERTFLPR